MSDVRIHSDGVDCAVQLYVRLCENNKINLNGNNFLGEHYTQLNHDALKKHRSNILSLMVFSAASSA